MSEDIELAAKAAGEAVEALAEASGVLGPVKQFADYLTKKIYYKQLPALAREATLAAEKIELLGLPRASISDAQVLGILEEGSRTADEDMQVVWANLLANALTESPAKVHTAFRRILGELEPFEVAALDMVADTVTPEQPTVSTRDCTESTGVSRDGLDNLVRLELLRYNRAQPTTWGEMDDARARIAGVMLTNLGRTFVQACRPPEPRSD
jgi:hypothetical protein